MRAAAIFGPGSSTEDLRPFQKHSDATWLIGAPASSNEADAILVFGGDGTVHRHLSQLVHLRLPVLVVPRGSGNDFARALSLNSTRAAMVAWQRFCSGDRNVRAIDLGTVRPLAGEQDRAGEPPAPHAHEHYFCCVAGVGLDAEVARRANRLPRWLRAHGGYVFSLAPVLFRFAAFPMKLLTQAGAGAWTESSSKPALLAALANTPTYGGGMSIAPGARLDDGQLDICVIAGVNNLKRLCLFPAVYWGRHLRISEVNYFQAERLRLETEKPSDVYADGEYVCQTPIEAGIARQALTVIVP